MAHKNHNLEYLSLEVQNVKQLMRPSLQTFGALQVGDLFGPLFIIIIIIKAFTVSWPYFWIRWFFPRDPD